MRERAGGQQTVGTALIVEPQTIFAPHLAFLAFQAGATHVEAVPKAGDAPAGDPFHLILIDPDYSESNPFDTVRSLAESAPRSAICVITGEHEPGLLLRFQLAGATSVVSKAASDVELVQALRLSLERRSYADARVDAA